MNRLTASAVARARLIREGIDHVDADRIADLLVDDLEGHWDGASIEWGGPSAAVTRPISKAAVAHLRALSAVPLDVPVVAGSIEAAIVAVLE